jgi:hypothetical protein
MGKVVHFEIPVDDPAGNLIGDATATRWFS